MRTSFTENQMINRFKIIKKLKQDANSFLFLSLDTVSQKKCNLKRIKKNFIHSPKNKQKAINQININRKLDHSNIMTMYEAFQDQVSIYLVFQTYQCTLQQILQIRGSLPAEQAVYYIRELMKALVYLHSLNIQHQDVTLHSIYITHNLQVKLGDFANAAMQQNDFYPTDSLCLGVSFYTMIFGFNPFPEQKKNLLFTIPDDDSVKPQIKLIIKSLLKSDQKLRASVQKTSQNKLFLINYKPSKVQLELPFANTIPQIPFFQDSVFLASLKYQYIQRLEQQTQYGLGYVNTLGQVGVIVSNLQLIEIKGKIRQIQQLPLTEDALKSLASKTEEGQQRSLWIKKVDRVDQSYVIKTSDNNYQVLFSDNSTCLLSANQYIYLQNRQVRQNQSKMKLLKEVLKKINFKKTSRNSEIRKS